MISIDGLTVKQRTMLDIMWAMDSYEEVRAWQMSLPMEDQLLVETLMELVTLEFMDEAVTQDGNYDIAQKIIQDIVQKDQ